MSSSWPVIERIARDLGVGEETLRKWRTRGVPLSRRLDLVNADELGEISQADFDSPPGSRHGAPGRPATNQAA